MKLLRIKNTRRSFSRALSIALLAVVLAGAQIAGIAHRIAHAPGLGGQAPSQAWLQQDQDGNRTPAHDCAAYDAATLGDGPPLAQSAQASPNPKQSFAATVVNAVADTSPHLPFHSRAPPRA